MEKKVNEIELKRLRLIQSHNKEMSDIQTGIHLLKIDEVPESVRTAIELLNSGEAILIFPEGTRGDGKVMLPISRGVGLLAKKTNALIIPVGLIGTKERLGKGSSKLHRSVITVVYGKPFSYAEVCTDTNEKRNRETFAKVLSARIVELCNAHGLMVKSGETGSVPEEESHPG